MRIVIILIINFSIFNCLGCAARESFELQPNWKKGEKLHYEMVKSRTKTQGYITLLKTSNRTDVEIEVLDVNDGGFVIAWTLGETRIDDPIQAMNPLTRKMVNIAKGLRIIMELDSKASIIRVLNWRELKEILEEISETVGGELKASGIDQRILDEANAQVAAMYASREQIERSCTQEAQLFLMALGIEFDESWIMEYEDRLTTPFGGKQVRTQARFELKELDKKLGVVKIKWFQKVDPEDASRVVDKYVRDMADRLGKPISNNEIAIALNIKDTAEFNFDLNSGWLKSMMHKRVTKADELSQEDSVKITRKKEKGI